METPGNKDKARDKHSFHSFQNWVSMGMGHLGEFAILCLVLSPGFWEQRSILYFGNVVRADRGYPGISNLARGV